MTAEPQFPNFTAPQPGPRRWRIAMANGPARTVEAIGFRVEHGALVLVLPIGNAAAFAPSTWSEIAPAADVQAPARDEGGRR